MSNRDVIPDAFSPARRPTVPDPVGLHDSRPLRERLQRALGDAYSIERELGGGMSRVFAARELRLDRVVVVKVLPPELGAALSGERFRREISLAARLQHPHIVPVHAAGEVEGIPWYTMPFIEGQSLRERLMAGALPVADVVRVLHDVADALAYAHEHGVVHRDIKPDNILLTRGHAVVTDFGVAKAVVAAAGRDDRPARPESARDPLAAGEDRAAHAEGARAPFAAGEDPEQGTLELHRHVGGTTDDGHRTAAGLAIGTPAYMAPEQAAGDPRTDHRADLYALGIVAWEMLTGRAVFGRRPPHELLAAQLTEHPVPVAELRPEVPEPLAELVARCLEKHPGDRPPSAAAVRDAIAAMGGGLSSGSGAARTGGRLRTRIASRWPILGAVAAGIVAMAAGGWFLVPRQAPLDDDVVAVVPFEVTAGSSLGYLREGMLDLLAAKLTGEGGPRSAEPRAVLAAWRRAAGSDTATLPRDRMLQLAERLGAGQLLMGEISGDPEHVVLAATVLRVRDGRVVVTEQEEGVVDSLPQLLDRLVGRLLARSAGEGERLPMLSRTSLPALRAYLAAQSAYRRGRYRQAVEEFARALDADSTFTLAALGLVEATDWVGDAERRTRGARLAWAGRDGLPERERARLESVVGPRGPGQPASYREQHQANVRYARLAPDRPEAVFRLGDGLFHYGRVIGIRDADVQARLQLQRTLTLDTTFAPALEHLALLAARDGDTTAAAEFGRRFLAVDSASESAEGVRWRLAAMRGDRAALEALVPRVAERGGTSLSYVLGAGAFEGVAPDLTARVLQEAARRPASANERSSLALAAHDLALVRGRPREAAGHLRRGAEAGLPPAMVLRERVKDALYWDGDTVEAARAVEELARDTPEASLPRFGTRDSTRNAYHLANVCMLERWRLGHGDTSTARRSLAAMRAWMNRRGDAPGTQFVGQCALTLDAQLAVLQRAPDAKVRVARLDSMLATGPQTSIQEIGNLIVARLREQTGDVELALAAVRRREFILTRPAYVTTYLREEARLAEATGDVDGAIAAYRQYLQLRADPEPELREDVESVRERLEQLLRQGS